MSAQNSGVVTVNGDAARLREKTVLVLGAARGGTSMVAGALAHLGVVMGEGDELAPFYEDPALTRCLRANDKQAARAIVQAYDGRYPVWGLKTLSRRLWWWLGLFREPVYIVVFRDIVATANRRAVSLGRSVLPEMARIGFFYLFLLAFLRLTRRPALILSYEKALLSPESCVDALGRFLGLEDPHCAQAAVQFIQPSPKGYTRRATTRSQMDAEGRWFGYVDLVEEDRIAGWVLSTESAGPTQVELVVNGLPRQVVAAALSRPDVARSDPRLRADCGFEFLFAATDRLRKGDKIDIRVLSSDIHLTNMPSVF